METAPDSFRKSAQNGPWVRRVRRTQAGMLY
ncbi:hypothetical protein CO2235_170145 [Cupriavidus oxalaticus]|uniref:Uncharacterized protein n=1 Tax=Cupriavidus oxalaticus TaxID=96344 RepID=A0A375G2P9_9BURK|nr:hypothetical protein CO2235_170145 [Cupriavidus oxalaticus]